MNLTQVLLIAIVAIGLYSLVDGRPINLAKENVFFGTVAGVEACTEIRKSSLLSEESTRTFCSRKHQGNLFSLAGQLNGEAAITPSALEGSIKNNTSEFIVTEIEFVAIVYDADGNESSFPATTNTWIVPGQELEFRAQYRSRVDQDTFPEDWCSRKAEGLQEVDCKAWAISSAKGIRF